MAIYFGPASKHLEELAKEAGLDIGELEIKKFPNNEIYVRFVDQSDTDNTLIQSTKTDSDIVTLLLMLDAHMEKFGEKPDVVIPYAGYSKQDKVFQEGEAISFRAILRAIYSQARTLHLITPHPREIRYGGIHEYHNMTLHCLDAIPLLADYLKKNIENPVLVGPDLSTNKMADQIREQIGGDIGGILEKYREQEKSGEGVVEAKIQKLEGELTKIEGENIVIVDDWISTGSTVIKAINKIKKAGNPKSIYVCVIHGEFANNAGLKILEAGATGIIATNTLENNYSLVSILPLIN